ncbi:MAG: hydroxyacid aldolase [Alphaproteobacteria bacterium]|nr:hydroxyacid aldolase [Alphaproteobacteria bacterium]
MSTSLRDRLATETPFLFSWMTMAGAQMAGQLARLRFDGVTLDLQHGLIGFADAAAMIGAINGAGKPAIVRVLWNDPGLIGQALDAGASAVIAPMVNSRTQAEALVKSAKYPPMGQRSWGGYAMVQAAKMTPAEYLAQANKYTLVFAMIETREAIHALDEIASVPGLDGLFVGPSDLSIALSNGTGLNRMASDVLEAMDKVAAACKRNNLVAGAFAGDAAIANAYIAKGFKFLAAAIDVDLLRLGAEAVLKDVKI